MADVEARRRGAGRHVRVLQRRLHLIAALAMVLYVYAAPTNPAVRSTVQWVVFPLLAGSGIVMCQWPRLRRLIRHMSQT
jgi:hypothetical protein